MLKGRRIREIQEEERKKTIKEVEKLPAELQSKVYDLFFALQQGINNYIGQKDKVIDGRIPYIAFTAAYLEVQKSIIAKFSPQCLNTVNEFIEVVETVLNTFINKNKGDVSGDLVLVTLDLIRSEISNTFQRLSEEGLALPVDPEET